MRLLPLTLLVVTLSLAAEPDFPLTADSQPQASVPKGELIKGTYTARDGSVFPGTVRDYQIYLPAGLDQTQPAAFMVFQDGVIYQAPVVFDNLIAKKDIPPLVGIFIKPGIVPAANDNALPRFNRSYEYDSITPTYSDFLIDEFLPAIKAKHSLKLSTDPNHAAISGNSSGGICAFMVAWHRPDRFRRIFTGVGTYVGIHGSDQIPVLVRKFEPKPLRIFLQSGTGDNNLYCGDWWMANQMLERSLTWAGYDVNHAWGEGGHNAKHATQIFPDVLRWLWRDWQTNIEIKANPKGESKWLGYSVLLEGNGWRKCWTGGSTKAWHLSAKADGAVFAATRNAIEEDGVRAAPPKTAAAKKATESNAFLIKIPVEGTAVEVGKYEPNPVMCMAVGPDGKLHVVKHRVTGPYENDYRGEVDDNLPMPYAYGLCFTNNGDFYFYNLSDQLCHGSLFPQPKVDNDSVDLLWNWNGRIQRMQGLALSPDQTTLYAAGPRSRYIASWQIHGSRKPANGQPFCYLDAPDDFHVGAGGLCVDSEGRLYVATMLGIQVCDQAGRVNFIISTPKQPHDVCFGGKDLSELFIACGDTIYKRPTKAKGIVSGQQPPIKPPPPKL